MLYHRNENGFKRAFDDIKRIAASHTDKEYVLYVDSRTKLSYSVILFSLFDAAYVEEGTVAHKVNAEGEMTPV